TEGAGMGAAGAMAFALARGALTLKTLYAALLESARTTAMLFLILIGALMFAEFVNITTMPTDLRAFVGRLGLSPIMVVAAICAIYVVLGTAMEELSMVLLTMPVFFPVVVQLGLDPVLFGISIVRGGETGLVRLDVVGLDRHLAAPRPVRHAALGGPLRRRRNVERGLARRVGIADVHGSHAGVEVGDEHELPVEQGRERLARRMGAEAAAPSAEAAVGLRDQEGGHRERPGLGGDVDHERGVPELAD